MLLAERVGTWRDTSAVLRNYLAVQNLERQFDLQVRYGNFSSHLGGHIWARAAQRERGGTGWGSRARGSQHGQHRACALLNQSDRAAMLALKSVKFFTCMVHICIKNLEGGGEQVT